MTVKELIEKLEKFDKGLEVRIVYEMCATSMLENVVHNKQVNIVSLVAEG